jgi:5-methylcytosine-specific restriction endonuclease McrA
MKPVDFDALFDVVRLPSTRDEALSAGVNRYFTGKPCRKGHVAARIVSDECCAECARLRKVGYRKRKFPTLESIEVRNAARRDRRRANPELRAKEALQKQEARKAGRWKEDPEKVNARSRAYKQRNPEKQREITERRRESGRTAENGKRYRARNPDRARASDVLKQAKRAGAVGVHTEEDLKAIRREQWDCCAACGEFLHGGGHVDHIVPLSKGGTNWPSNIQWLCSTCNLRKSAKDYDVFLAEQGLTPWYRKQR